MNLPETIKIDCPYCGERIYLVIDYSVSDQEYIEDCSVCCRPILLQVTIDDDGTPAVEARREND